MRCQVFQTDHLTFATLAQAIYSQLEPPEPIVLNYRIKYVGHPPALCAPKPSQRSLAGGGDWITSRSLDSPYNLSETAYDIELDVDDTFSQAQRLEPMSDAHLRELEELNNKVCVRRAGVCASRRAGERMGERAWRLARPQGGAGCAHKGCLESVGPPSTGTGAAASLSPTSLSFSCAYSDAGVRLCLMAILDRRRARGHPRCQAQARLHDGLLDASGQLHQRLARHAGPRSQGHSRRKRDRRRRAAPHGALPAAVGQGGRRSLPERPGMFFSTRRHRGPSGFPCTYAHVSARLQTCFQILLRVSWPGC